MTMFDIRTSSTS